MPLWHLAFLNPGMAHARNLTEGFLLFGAYPAEREGKVEGALRSAVASSRGRALSAAEAHRAWGRDSFPSRPLSFAVSRRIRELVSLAELPAKLSAVEDHPEHAILQGTVARSEEVLLLTLEDHEEGTAR